MSYMYYCPKCNKLYKAGGVGKKIKCSQCSEYVIDMNISSDEYNALNAKQRQDLKESVSKNNTVHSGIENTIDNSSVSGSSDNSEIECPQCKNLISSRFKFCPECGYSFQNKSQSESILANDVKCLMYACPNCKKVYKVKGNNKIFKCKNCSDSILINSGIDADVWSKYKPEYKQELIALAIGLEDNQLSNTYFKDFEYLKNLYNSEAPSIFDECKNLLAKEEENYVAMFYKALSTCKFSCDGDTISQCLKETRNVLKIAFEELGVTSKYIQFTKEFVLKRLELVAKKRSNFNDFQTLLENEVLTPYLLGIKSVENSFLTKDDGAVLLSTLMIVDNKIKEMLGDSAKASVLSCVKTISSIFNSLEFDGIVDDTVIREAAKKELENTLVQATDKNKEGTSETKEKENTTVSNLSENKETTSVKDNKDRIVFLTEQTSKSGIELVTEVLRAYTEMMQLDMDGPEIMFVGRCKKTYKDYPFAESFLQLHRVKMFPAQFMPYQIERLANAMKEDLEFFMDIFNTSLKDKPAVKQLFEGNMIASGVRFVFVALAKTADQPTESLDSLWRTSIEILEKYKGDSIKDPDTRMSWSESINDVISALNHNHESYYRLYNALKEYYKDMNGTTVGLAEMSKGSLSKPTNSNYTNGASTQEDIYTQMLNHPAAKNMMWCPSCGQGKLVPMSEATGGFSGKKAMAGAALVGPIGLAAGLTGKKQVTYECFRCHYRVTK